MRGERAWVETVKTAIEPMLQLDGVVTLKTAYGLPYALNVVGYSEKLGELSTLDPTIKSHKYQTDLLVADLGPSGQWMPSLVIEFKLGRVTTHDALTYSTKAATHKNVHPYLRYGIVIGRYRGQVPKRLIRHGQHFDFMATIESEVLTESDLNRLARLIEEEVRASRALRTLLTKRSHVRLLHRRLEAH